MSHFKLLLLALTLFSVVASAEFTLTAEFHGKNSSENFAYGVDLDGDYAVLGSPVARNDPSPDTQHVPGAAYVLHRDSDGWKEVQVLYGEDDGDYFGYDVAISGDWIAVGELLTESDSGPQDSGSVSLYKQNGAGVFEFKQRLVNPEQDVADYFGLRVSIDGDRLIVGAPLAENETSTAAGETGAEQGSVFIFERTGDTWSLVFTDHGSDQGGNLGYNVAISGDYAFGGSHTGDSSLSEPGNDRAGVLFVYHRSATGVWSMTQTLTAPTPESQELFSRGLNADGDLLATGAVQAEGGAGELIIFRRNGDGQYELEAVIPGSSSRIYLGLRITIAHGVIATGSFQDFTGAGGAVTIYQQVAGTWTATHTLNATDVGSSGDSIFSRGLAIEVTGTHATVIAGAHAHTNDTGDADTSRAGAAFVFENADISLNDGEPQDSAQWTAPCGCDGLGSAPIIASVVDSTSVTLSFDATLPEDAPCVAEPAP